ncbi:hypothetical protein FH972_022057 [Carpinus fangiana]|uniref:Uncharacterized protein n=1 Tax=Carpinus fangiana TaxID=176857 RepID=A0A5N6KTB6_9ROSI|nr:hypothetical protein FH972_022057 [Carpinus fangiana]
MDDPHANLTVSRNKGRESTAYLTYIIDNYHNLPEYVIFLHALRYQWHNEDPMYDGVPPIRNLRLSYVEQHGYANMRCTWSLGCPAELHPYTDPSKIEEALAGNNDRDKTEAAFTRAYLELFPDAKAEEAPTAVGIPCGAQFALSRWMIQSRPLDDYKRIRNWLWATELPDAVSGRILEYSWHVLMGKPFEYCPSAKECFCDKFGLCDLECRQVGSCEKRYKLPQYATIPNNWPKEGAGKNGFPEWGWWE